MNLRRTPLYDEHVKSKAKIVDFAGWEMPIQYKGIIEEHDTVRNHVGIFDVSHMGEIEISGSHALLNSAKPLPATTLLKLKPGKIQYSAILNEQGGVIDDCTSVPTCRATLSMFVVNASRKDEVLNWFLSHKIESAWNIKDLSDDYGLIALQGKKAQAHFWLK
jgi:aminomethyltransferase